MSTRITIAAGLSAAILASVIAAPSANAGRLYDAFCKGPTPTPEHICDQIRATEAAQPSAPAQAGNGQLKLKQKSAKKGLAAPTPQR